MSRQAKELVNEVDYIVDYIVDCIVDCIDQGGGGQCVDFLLFCQNPDFHSDFGLEIRILTPSRVEMIVKRSIFGLKTITNR